MVVALLEACGSCGKTLSDKLQRPQNCADRVITYSSYDANANELKKILGWKILVYKSLNGLAPNYLSSIFIQRSDIITSSDSENKLAVPLPPAPITIKIVSAIAVQFSGTVCRLLQAKSLPNFRLMLNVSVITDTAFMEKGH